MICTSWLPVQRRIQFKILLTTWRCIQKVPLTISRNFAVSSPQYWDVVSFDRRRQVVTRYLLDLPKVRTVTMQKRVFAHAGPTCWNTIPEALQSRVMNCTLDTVKNISNHFSLFLQDNSLLFWFSVNFSSLLTKLNEITIALLKFQYKELRQKKKHLNK